MPCIVFGNLGSGCLAGTWQEIPIIWHFRYTIDHKCMEPNNIYVAFVKLAKPKIRPSGQFSLAVRRTDTEN